MAVKHSTIQLNSTGVDVMQTRNPVDHDGLRCKPHRINNAIIPRQVQAATNDQTCDGLPNRRR